MDISDFIAGSLGGAAGVLAGHPLDTIKVRLQTQSSTGTKYRGIINCCTSIIRHEGARGLFKGLSSPLASLTVVNAVVFGVHGNVAKSLGDPTSISTHFLAGSAAGAAQAFIAAPTEMVKLRVQIQHDAAHTVYRSPYHCAQLIIRQQGIRPLFRGMLATQIRDCPAFGIYFASYEYMARKLSRDGTMEALTSWQLLFAGGAAGMLSWLFNYPTDVVKTRFQADDSYKTYAQVIRSTYRENGIRTFYVGLGSTLLRAFPSNAATFFTVEWTYRILLDLKMLQIKNLPSLKASAGGNADVSHLLATHQILANHFDSTAPCRPNCVTMNDFWYKNSFLLPEAGTTLIEPILPGSWFL